MEILYYDYDCWYENPPSKNNIQYNGQTEKLDTEKFVHWNWKYDIKNNSPTFCRSTSIINRLNNVEYGFK